MLTTGSSFTLTPGVHAVANATAQPAPQAHHFSFHDFLSIINPLQHLPVIGTIYRAVTGDEIKTPEKIAGDTLYGGPLGGLSSVADALYTQKTGKSFGDTVLGWLGFHHDSAPTDVAQTADASASKTASAAMPADPTTAALSESLQRNGVSYDVAQRALFAYRRSSASASPFAD
jgi:hypothetical protein